MGGDMSFSNSQFLKVKNGKWDCIVTEITHLSDEDKEFILEYLVEISGGRESTYSAKTIATKTSQFLRAMDQNKFNGATAEFFLVCILRKAGFVQEFCYKNLEEGSIKKGFDGVYSKDSHIWVAESKSSESEASHRYNHKNTIDKAYSSLEKLIGGKTKNDPWENAVNHAKSAGSDKSLIKKLTKLSENYIDGNVSQIENESIIIGSTVIAQETMRIESGIDEIDNIIIKHKAKNETVAIINLKSCDILKDFLDEVVKNGA